MNLTVLRTAIDTLEVSFDGAVFEEIADKLDSLKARAQATEQPQPFLTLPFEFMVQPNAFGRWRWFLKHPELHVVLNRADKAGLVSAQVRLYALGLGNTGAANLYANVLLALKEIGTYTELNVSRADVCADFQGWTPAVVEMTEHIATHTTFRPIYPNLTKPETFLFGKGEQLLRVYNKTEEIASERWSFYRNLWQGSPDYLVEQDVWRIEAQHRRGSLAKLGVNYAHQVIENPGALLDHTMRTFAQLRVPTEDSNLSRWPEDPRWTAIREANAGDRPLERRVELSLLLDLDSAMTRLLGLFAICAARFGTKTLEDTMVRVALSLEARIIQDKLDFAASVESKRCRLMSGTD